MKTQKQAEDLIRLLCSSCGKRVKVSPKFAGQSGKCPKCGQAVQIPGLEVLEQKLKEIKGKSTDDSVDVPDLPEQVALPGEHKGLLGFNPEDPPEPTAELLGLDDDLQSQKIIMPEIPLDVQPQRKISEGTSKRIPTTIKPSAKPSNQESQKNTANSEQPKTGEPPKSVSKSGNSITILQKPDATIKSHETLNLSPLRKVSTPEEPPKPTTPVHIGIETGIEVIGEVPSLPNKWESPDPEQIFAEQHHDWPEELEPLEPIMEAEIQSATLDESNNLQMAIQVNPSSPVEEIGQIEEIAETDAGALPSAVPISAETLLETASPIQPSNSVRDKEVVEIQELSDSSDFTFDSQKDMEAEKELIAIEKLLAENKIQGGETLLLGKKALEATNFDEAIQYLSTCINSGEDIGAAYYLRALAFIQKKAWYLAMDDLRNAIEFNYQDVSVEDLHNRVVLQQAISFRNMGAYRQALELLEQIISKNTTVEKGKVYWTRARFLIQAGAQQTAMRDLEEAILHNYLKPEVFEARGRIYLEQGDYDSAMHDFVAAINRGGKSASLYQARSEAYFFLRDLDSALEDIHLAQNFAPEDPLLWDFEGLILNEKKMYSASDEAFEKSFGIEPENHVHYFNRGLCYMRRGRYDRAIEDFTKVIEANPKDRIAYLKRAICYQEKNNPNLALAREDFKKAENLEPNSMYRATKVVKRRKELR